MASIPPKRRIEAAKELARRAVTDGIDHVKRGVRDGVLDARSAKLDVPARREYARSFVFAVALPFSLLRLAWSDLATRASMVGRLKAPIGGFTLFAVLLGLHLVRLLPGPVDHLVVEIGGALVQIGEGIQSCIPTPDSLVPVSDHSDAKKPSADKVPAAGEGDGGGAASDGEAEEEIDEAAGEIAEAAGGLLGANVVFGGTPDAGDASVKEQTKAKVAGLLRGIAEHSDGGASGMQLRVNTKKHAPGTAGDLHAGAGEKRETSSVSDVVGVLGALYVLEWILIWIWREHHDAIANEVSTAVGIPAEPLERAPKLRFDFGFLKLKVVRALRFVFFTSLVTPASSTVGLVIILIGELLHADRAAPYMAGWLIKASVLLAAGYWGAVFGAANASVAWDAVPDGWEPWFMRALARPARIPLLGLPFRLYRAFVRKVTRKVWPACLAFEQAPVESVGITVGKAVAVLPGTYLLLRPFFGPAATHLVMARRAGDGVPPPP